MMNRREKDAMTMKRILAAGGALAIWAVIIVVRLVDLQVLQHDDYCRQAVAQQEQTKVIPAARGSIFDRHGQLLAVCRKADTVYIAPAQVTNVYGTAAALSKALGLDRQRLIKTCRRDLDAVFVKRMVPAEEADLVRAMGLDGVGLMPENDRHYPQGELACHVLGFTDMDNSGKYGVEQQFNEDIAGRDGQWFVCRDALGRPYNPGARPATAGRDLVLTIDTVIQYQAERALDEAMGKSGARWGSVVVMDVWNGDVLAMASRPGFDPNRYNLYNLDRMSNLAVNRIYEPGSTFKLITMAAALEDDLLDLDREIDCGNGRIRVGRGWINDHKPFDKLVPAEIIAKSSNVGAIQVGRIAGSRRLHEMITAFGFGRKTGIRLPWEEAGLVKPVKSWSGRTCATISFGQEISVTPLQLCRAVAAIASDGTLRTPRLVLQTQDREGNHVRRFKPRTEGRPISERTASILREMMAGVVADGTGKKAASDSYQTAGKTGTAQMIIDGAYADNRFVASFAGFAPLHLPRIAVVAVLAEVRRPHYHGGDVAAPVFREVVDGALRRLAVPADRDEILLAGVEQPPAQPVKTTADAGGVDEEKEKAWPASL